MNVVCSDLVEDAYEKYKDYFPGNTPVPMHKIVDGYVKCIEGKINGRIPKNAHGINSYYEKNTTLRSRTMD